MLALLEMKWSFYEIIVKINKIERVFTIYHGVLLILMYLPFSTASNLKSNGNLVENIAFLEKRFLLPQFLYWKKKCGSITRRERGAPAHYFFIHSGIFHCLYKNNLNDFSI